MRGTSSPIREVATRLALVVVSLGVVLGLLEGMVRILWRHPPLTMDEFRLSTSSFYQPDSVLGWVPKPRVVGSHVRKGSFSSTFRTNEHGFRDRTSPFRTDSSTTRIVVVGDSFTWGYGVNDDEVYTERLEASLEGVEVINLGVAAYGLRQELALLERVGMRCEPDLVVLGLCLNDIPTIDAPFLSPPDRAEESRPRIRDRLRAASALWAFVSERINASPALARALVRVGLKRPLRGIADLDPSLSPALRHYPPDLQRAWEETKGVILAMRDLVASTGARLIVAVIPARQSVSEEAFAQSLAYSALRSEDFDLDKPYGLIQQFGDSCGIPVISPLWRFRSAWVAGARPYLPNDMHFSPLGHTLFAEEIAAYLTQGGFRFRTRGDKP